MTERPSYWVCQTRVIYWRRQMVQASLVTPPTRPRSPDDCGYGFRGPNQAAPYAVELQLAYRVNPRHPHPDNYLDSFGFTLFSERLVNLVRVFGVDCEVFPVTVLDQKGELLPDLRYFICHLLGDAVDAMDRKASEWTGDTLMGVPGLVLASGGFASRPLFLLKHLYVRLMRDDLRQEIERQGITGFRFLDPARYRSGRFGLPPEFTD